MSRNSPAAFVVAAVFVALAAACGSDNPPASVPTQENVSDEVATPTTSLEDQRSSAREQRLEATGGGSSEQPEPVPMQVTEEVLASSVDGVLFDITLSSSVFDGDGDGSFRDEIEVLSPGSTEFQGHFPAPTGDLVIVSCFAPECQEGDGPVTFEVRYWTTDDLASTEQSRSRTRR